MNIGILTFHNANNYGAVLQAYALQETIKSLDKNVEIIDYRQDYIINKYKVIRINTKSIRKTFRSVISTIIHFREFSKREKVFNKFRKNYLNISRKTFENSIDINGYDAYISGSDQVWNSELTKFDDAFFFNFCADDENARRISYAASIGSEVIDKKEEAFLKSQINNLDYISVRENSALKLVDHLTNNKVERVLDPTLLADVTIWNKLVNQTTEGEKYILVYSVGPIENIVEISEHLRKKLGLNLLYVTEKRLKSSKGRKHLKGVSPEKLLSLIKGAHFVITNSFHGTAFSVIFNKNFITIPHKKSGTRMVSLLELLELNHRVVESIKDLNNTELMMEIDYDSTNLILEEEKNKSLNYLKTSLAEN